MSSALSAAHEQGGAADDGDDNNAPGPHRIELPLVVASGGRAQQPDSEAADGPTQQRCAAELRSHSSTPSVAREGDLDSVVENEEASVTQVSAAAEAAPAKTGFGPPEGWPPARRWPRWYWGRLTGYDQSLSTYGFHPSWDQLTALVFTCLTLVVLGLLEHYGFYPLLNHTLFSFLPALGASCTVVFAIPKAPIAQPRNVILSHVSAAIIGTALTNAFRSVSQQPFGQHCAGAIGVALHLVLMMFTNTMHPPASATVISAATATINAYYRDEGFLFVITPVLLGAVITTVCAWLLNNLVPSRSPYPQYW
ncbi:HPP family [Novymonas esmeraldas]|uniref:HPP family n=1 Tax=Novymonas esmeraldas TaxID=1808958 RepID=A0AAW0ESC4_9TRYP